MRGRRGRGGGGEWKESESRAGERKGISDRFIYGGNRDREVKTL